MPLADPAEADELIGRFFAHAGADDHVAFGDFRDSSSTSTASGFGRASPTPRSPAPGRDPCGTRATRRRPPPCRSVRARKRRVVLGTTAEPEARVERPRRQHGGRAVDADRRRAPGTRPLEARKHQPAADPAAPGAGIDGQRAEARPAAREPRRPTRRFGVKSHGAGDRPLRERHEHLALLPARRDVPRPREVSFPGRRRLEAAELGIGRVDHRHDRGDLVRSRTTDRCSSSFSSPGVAPAQVAPGSGATMPPRAQARQTAFAASRSACARERPASRSASSGSAAIRRRSR